MCRKQRGKIKYIISEDQRSVIAFKTGIEEDVVRKFYKSSSNGPNIDLEKYLLLPDKLFAEAKCHPDDVWDVEIGKEVARKRLAKMYRKFASNACSTYLKKIEQHINFVNKIKEKYVER